MDTANYVVLEPVNNPKAKNCYRRIVDDKGTLTGGMTSVGNGLYKDRQSERNGGYGYNVYKIVSIAPNLSAAKAYVKYTTLAKEALYGKLDPVKF